MPPKVQALISELHAQTRDASRATETLTIKPPLASDHAPPHVPILLTSGHAHVKNVEALVAKQKALNADGQPGYHCTDSLLAEDRPVFEAENVHNLQQLKSECIADAHTATVLVEAGGTNHYPCNVDIQRAPP